MFREKCDVEGCKKLIEGFTENQVRHLLAQHQLAKHYQKKEDDNK